MNLDTIIDLDAHYYMNTFGKRNPVCFDHGAGIYLYSIDGKKYVDFFAGIAVCALGHCHPSVVNAITEQAGKLIHCSNLYYIEKQTELAQLLCQFSCAVKVFFFNSGAEANEAALKLARAFFHKQNQAEKNEIICLENSFHGRTLTTATATGQEKYKKLYTPLTPGFRHVPINDYEALREAINENTCAVMLEPVQGESGVYPLTREYAAKVRKLCDELGLLLIFDEVQTGFGRTGHLFGYQYLGVEPDIFTLAKALGGGFPIACVCAKMPVSDCFEPGDHGSTFGGNPLACAAGLASVRTIINEQLPENAQKVGTYFRLQLEKVRNGEIPAERSSDPAYKDCRSRIAEIRNAGLMVAIQFEKPIVGRIKDALFNEGWLVGSVGANTLRILPPLIITEKDVDAFINVLCKITI